MQYKNTVAGTRSAGRGKCAWLLGCLALGMAVSAAAAQQEAAWPQRPVTIVVPVAAGGGTDIISRALGDRLGQVLGQPVVVRNQPGANGTIGSSAVARAPADGYTLLVGTIGTHGANACLYDLPYDPEGDFTPVALMAQYNNAVVVSAQSDIRTLDDLVRKARAEPGKLSYGITVIGSSGHLAVENFRHVAGIDALGVPYNGAVAATVDLIGGRVDFVLDTVVSQYGNITGGKVRALATTGAGARSPVLPDVPTVAESGYPEFDAAGWVGLFAPDGTPPQVVEAIADAVREVYGAGEIQKNLGAKGLEVRTTTPQEFARYVQQEKKKWCDVIEQSDIKVH